MQLPSMDGSDQTGENLDEHVDDFVPGHTLQLTQRVQESRSEPVLGQREFRALRVRNPVQVLQPDLVSQLLDRVVEHPEPPATVVQLLSALGRLLGPLVRVPQASTQPCRLGLDRGEFGFGTGEPRFASAVLRPQVTVFAEDAYPGLPDKAAALLHGIARDRALVDGNKRLAWAATRVLLLMNGCRLEYAIDDAEVTVVAVAAGDIGDARLAVWLQALIKAMDVP